MHGRGTWSCGHPLSPPAPKLQPTNGRIPVATPTVFTLYTTNWQPTTSYDCFVGTLIRLSSLSEESESELAPASMCTDSAQLDTVASKSLEVDLLAVRF